MLKNLHPILFGFFLFSILSCKETELPPAPESKGFIKGNVYNEFGQPIDNAKVTVDLGKSPFSEFTKQNGSFEISGILVGNRDISIEKKGFISYSGKIQIDKDVTTEVDFVLKSGATLLEVNDSSFVSKFSGDEFKIEVFSNSGWLIVNGNEWIKTSIDQGNGNGEIIFSVSSNSGLDGRKGSFTIKSGEVQREIKVEQFSASKILEVKSIYGFSSVSRSDSVRLTFNNPIKITSINPSLSYCYPNFPFLFTYGPDRKSVTFEYECGDLGWSYAFEIAFEDDQGNKFTENFEVDFFDKKYVLEGVLQQKSVDHNENSIWILTYGKNLLYKISMADLSVIHKFEIPFEPRGFAINDLKKEIYVYAYHKAYFEVYDQLTFKYLRRINILKDDFDHPDYPVVYPYDLQFTKSGVGIFSLEAGSSSSLKWKIIDSQKNDLIRSHSQYGYDFHNSGEYRSFDRIYQNNDKSKLLMVSSTDYVGIAVYDPGTDKFSHSFPGYITRSDFLVPNRTNNLIYVLQLYNQSLYNPVTKFETENSFFSTIGQGLSADFAYNSGNESLVYFYKDNNLAKIDYSTMKYETIRTFAGLSNLVLSSEGESLFLFRIIGNHLPGTNHYYTTMYQVNTDKLPDLK